MDKTYYEIQELMGDHKTWSTIYNDYIDCEPGPVTFETVEAAQWYMKERNLPSELTRIVQVKEQRSIVLFRPTV